jgi:hypothetical protein
MRAWVEGLLASPALSTLAKANTFKAMVLNLMESQTTVEALESSRLHTNSLLQLRSCILYVVLAESSINYPIVLRLNPYMPCVNDYQPRRYVRRSWLGKAA